MTPASRSAYADFLAGGIFGGALLVAGVVLALVVFLPIGRTDWATFTRGAIVLPGIVLAVFAIIIVALRGVMP